MERRTVYLPLRGQGKADTRGVVRGDAVLTPFDIMDAIAEAEHAAGRHFAYEAHVKEWDVGGVDARVDVTFDDCACERVHQSAAAFGAFLALDGVDVSIPLSRGNAEALLTRVGRTPVTWGDA